MDKDKLDLVREVVNQHSKVIKQLNEKILALEKKVEAQNKVINHMYDILAKPSSSANPFQDNLFRDIFKK